MSVVEQWSENVYFQSLCGMYEFVPSFPCNVSELVHFRKRIDKQVRGVIFKESIRANDDNDDGHHDTDIIVFSR